LLPRIGTKLSVRSGGAEEPGMQPCAGTTALLDNRFALASLLKLGSLKRIVGGGLLLLLSGRLSDSLGTAAEGLRGFCLMAAAAAAGGGGRGYAFGGKMGGQFSVFRVEKRKQMDEGGCL
jgi:hypothetical protein